jgi:hypothetical protein
MEKKSGQYASHQVVCQALASVARSCGIKVSIEPHVPAKSGQKIKENARPDLEFQGLHRDLIVEVSLTTATAKSYVKQAAETDGYAAEQREKVKLAKYKDHAALMNVELLPFVMERHGRMGKSCEQVFLRLAQMAHDVGLELKTDHFAKIASIACQRANGKLVEQAMRQRKSPKLTK